MKEARLSNYFLISLVILSLVACFLLFKPFLIKIIVSAVLVSVFYSPYLKLSKLFRGRKNLAAATMCILLLAVIIIPIVWLIIYTGQKSSLAYGELASFINNYNQESLENNVLAKIPFIGEDKEAIKSFILSSSKKLSDYLSKMAASIIKGTTSFIFSLILMILTMFFFFIDGEKLLHKLKIWSPLPNKYDREIFQTFNSISYTSLISTFVTAAAQGVVGGIGFFIIGLPAVFIGTLIAFTSLIPYIGSMIIYVPIGIYLVISGQLLKGVFILIWGSLIVGNTDGVIRAYLLHDKTKISPIFIAFSFIGGLALFGFWGLIIGPLILSITIVILKIYEREYGAILDKK